MKMMHKVTALLLVLSLMAALSGCTGSGTQETQKTTEPAATQPVTEQKPTEEPTQAPTQEPTVIPGEDPVDPTIEVEDEEDSFVSSVAQAGDVVLSGFHTEKSRGVAAVIHNGKKEEVTSYYRHQLQIITLEDRNGKDVTKEQKEALEKAYDSIVKAEGLEKIAANLEAVLKEMDASVAPADLVVWSLFHVEPNEEARKLLEEEGSTITIAINVEDIQENDFVAVMQYDAEENSWTVLDAKDVKILKEGKLQVKFANDIGTIAVLVEKA